MGKTAMREGRHRLQCSRSSCENAPLFASGFSFDDYTYARYSHMRMLNGNYIVAANGSPLDIHFCDLKAYQDAFASAFIDQNLPFSGLNILEVGGGHSRVLPLFSTRHECWNIDKFDGLGSGPRNVPTNINYRLVQDYMGSGNPGLPNAYFDAVFSISALEHVPEEIEIFKNILQDIDRVLKPGGYSFHLFDIVLRSNKTVWMNAFVKYIYSNITTLNTFIPLDKVDYMDDIFIMSRPAYYKMWFSITKKPYNEFGKPSSICVFWKKPIQQLMGD